MGEIPEKLPPGIIPGLKSAGWKKKNIRRFTAGGGRHRPKLPMDCGGKGGP